MDAHPPSVERPSVTIDLPSDARVLIVRTSAIGDIVHGLPVLNALRAARPKAFIAWIVEDRGAGLLHAHPALDEVIVLPRRWYYSPRIIWQTRQQLRELRFDLAIDQQGLSKSAGLGWMACAKWRIGFGGHDGREISTWFNNERVVPARTHVIDRNLELLRPLGIVNPPVRYGLVDGPHDIERAEEILSELNLPERFAVINPGASWPSKLWPPERFAAVAAALGREHGMPSLVLWGGAKELELAEPIVARSQGHALLAPPTTLGELAALARRASLFVSSDTGPLHIASAVGTPCVGLYGPVACERNGPYGAQHIAIQKMRVIGNSRKRRRASNEAMCAIAVDDVLEACHTILNRTAAQHRVAG